MNIDRAALIAIMKSTVGRVVYSWGAKPGLSWRAETVKKSDCSGYVRYLLYKITGGKVKLPLGSWFQRQWFIDNDYTQCPYTDCSKADSILRIAFLNPRKGKAGHVWLCASGNSIESYGGHGAGRRQWNTPVLMKSDSCFVIGKML